MKDTDTVGVGVDFVIGADEIDASAFAITADLNIFHPQTGSDGFKGFTVICGTP